MDHSRFAWLLALHEIKGKEPTMSNLDSLPISAINAYLYCPRRAGLILIEQTFSDNHHTSKGKQVHQRVDVQGQNNQGDITMIRSLPVWSVKLGIHGRCDMVEKHPDGAMVPVEYKKGGGQAYQNDDAQVCAQAMCLEEMLSITIPYGMIYHAKTKRRRKVMFTEELKELTKKTINALHTLINSGAVPSAKFSAKCHACSMNHNCMPRLTDQSAWNHKKQSIFRPQELKET